MTMADMNDLLGYLPPSIDGVLIDLMRDSPPNRDPLPLDEQRALDWRRAIALQVAHDFIERRRQGHDQAVEIISKAWQERTAFCLYLRNFGLGARGSESATKSEKEVIKEITQVLEEGEQKPTFFNSKDPNLQSFLTEQVAPSIPVMAIENPIWDLRGHKGGVPKLVLDDAEWMSVAKAIVPAAHLIIFYIAHASTGVLTELEILRDAERQADTVILLDSGEADSTALPPLMDFPHVLNWDVSESDRQRLVATVEEICSRRVIGVFDKFPQIMGRKGPPEILRRRANYVAHQSYLEAISHIEAGKFERAEDALVRCLVLCFCSEYSEGRARAFLELARLQYHGRNESSLSRGNYQRAVELYRREAPYSSSARDILPLVVKEYEEINSQS